MRVLLIEDDKMIGEAMQQGLVEAGFAIDWVLDGRAAELALGSDVYDLAVLDLNLPRKSGMDVLRELRARGKHLPVLIVTARDAVEERIAGLNAGADDYVLKPFDLDELVARLHALLRRRHGRSTSVLSHGALVVDAQCRTVTLRGEAVSLSAREFAILEALMQQPGAVLSREKLEESVYGWRDEIGSNAIEVHLYHLRKKLGAEAIRNVRGVGYKMGELPDEHSMPQGRTDSR